MSNSLNGINDIRIQKGISDGVWNSISEDDKWKMAIANYNLSVGSGDALRIATEACTSNFSWGCISSQLNNNSDTHLAVGYAEKVMNFAQQGCTP